MFLKWNNIYSVNVKEIDDQHKKIFDIINKFYESKKHKGTDDLIAIIEDLKQYGNYHLETEEKYFEEFDYPDKESHIAEHEGYRKKIIEFEEKIIKFKNGEIVSDECVSNLTIFLRDWWINHIQNSDQEYSHFFNDKGLY